MAKAVKKVEIPVVQKLTSAEIDARIIELLKLDQEAKVIGKRVQALKKELEDQYVQADNIPEIVKGLTTEMEKIPVDNGRNKFNVDLLKPFLTPLRLYSKLVKMVPVIDVPALMKLVKDGVIPEAVLDACRISVWTFKSQFRRQEATAQTAPQEEVKQAV